MKIAVLHPGAMGASVCAALASAGAQVFWVDDGRSDATRQRAQAFDSLPSLAALRGNVEAVISVCPPDAAQALSEAVHATGFDGWYLDANAIEPARAQVLHARWGELYIDGGIIGPPAWQAGTTRLYLSGPHAGTAATWFSASLLDAVPIDGAVTAASALKMCYAAYTKGQAALLLSVRALADRLGVDEALVSEWELSQPGLNGRVVASARGVAPKAWRFEGEMREIARTFAAAGLPDGFHLAAAEIYGALAGLKDRDVGLEDVMGVLGKAKRAE